MTLTQQIAQQFREFYYGENWTGSNLQQHLSGVTWQEAVAKVDNFNTIADLVFHMNYYVSAALKVFAGQPLDASDRYSFPRTPVEYKEDWDKLLDAIWKDAEDFANLIERMPESDLWKDFWEQKYGNYYKNILGITEHNHYHLGQIVLLKKMLPLPNEN
jgi:uncharacterized damage-inducible protein DinB